MTAVEQGAVVHLATTDLVAPIDLPAWCRLTGHTCLVSVAGAPTPAFGVHFNARPVPTDPHRLWSTAR